MPGNSIEITADGYRLALLPALGGSIARFDWHDQPLMRPASGSSVLDTAGFPLVPFSNRIAFGRFVWDGRVVQLPRNFPGRDHPHTIHGFGWLSPWQVVAHQPARALLRQQHKAGAWPWAYQAEQEFLLAADGLRHILRLQNLSETAMPAGLGVHPYFPRDEATLFHGLHRAEWETAADGLPLRLRQAPEAIDWWHGAPLGSRTLDTVYEGREGPLTIEWPTRSLALAIDPSPDLPFTVVYTPAGADHCCIEPVSHATDVLNRDPAAMHRLAPGETMEVAIRYTARRL